MTIAPELSNYSAKELTSAANLAFEQQINDINSQAGSRGSYCVGDLNHNIVYDADYPLRPKFTLQKRKDSVSSLVDNIFSDINGSFFLDPQRKKRKISEVSDNGQSLSRCGKSYAVLQDSLSRLDCSVKEPADQDKVPRQAITLNPSSSEPPISLSPEDSAINILDNIFFPNLPATVSISSCVSKNSSNSKSENVSCSYSDACVKDTVKNSESNTHYGWFVHIDEGVTKSHDSPSPQAKRYKRSSAVDELAFKAPTAPKRVDDEAELEWASAADTVDNVLCDLF